MKVKVNLLGSACNYMTLACIVPPSGEGRGKKEEVRKEERYRDGRTGKRWMDGGEGGVKERKRRIIT